MVNLNPYAPVYIPFSSTSILSYYHTQIPSHQPQYFVHHLPHFLHNNNTNNNYHLPSFQSGATYCNFTVNESSAALGYFIPRPFQHRATLTLLNDDGEEVSDEMMKVKTAAEIGLVSKNYVSKMDANDEEFCGHYGSSVGDDHFVRRRRVWFSRCNNNRRRGSVVHDHEVKKSCENFEFGVSDHHENKTTLMIKNLPNKFKKEMLMTILDNHCFEENKKLKSVEDKEEKALSEYDFLYVPIDFKSGSNKGYAFVNFTSAIAALRLYNFLHNYNWSTHGSRKVCEITYARVQGLSSLVKHFKRSTFCCDNDDFLPVVFNPSRNGDNYDTNQEFIGLRISY